MDGILSDTAIHNAILDGRIQIDPYRPEHLNPTSYDVTLGEWVAVYKNVVTPSLFGVADHVANGLGCGVKGAGVLNSKLPLEVDRFRMDPRSGWFLKPGIGYLMHTEERIHTSVYVPVLDGKSTIGRLFVSIHETAGFGDVGFNGQFTLEVTCTHPVILYPGMRIGQIRFHTVCGEVGKAYDQTGKYKGELAEGPVPSQAYRMFRTS